MKRCLAVLVALLLSTSALAQSLPMATTTGKVTSGGAGLPGVRVTVSSPHLQGTRDTYLTDDQRHRARVWGSYDLVAVNYKVKETGFGEPDSEGDFQPSRTFRFSVGVRF